MDAERGDKMNSRKIKQAISSKDQLFKSTLAMFKKIKKAKRTHKEFLKIKGGERFFHSSGTDELSRECDKASTLLKMVLDGQVVFGMRIPFIDVLDLAIKGHKVEFDPALVRDGLAFSDFLYRIKRWADDNYLPEIGLCVFADGKLWNEGSYCDLVFFTRAQLEIGTIGVMNTGKEELRSWLDVGNKDAPIYGVKIEMCVDHFDFHYAIPIRQFDTQLFTPPQR